MGAHRPAAARHAGSKLAEPFSEIKAKDFESVPKKLIPQGSILRSSTLSISDVMLVQAFGQMYYFQLDTDFVVCFKSSVMAQETGNDCYNVLTPAEESCLDALSDSEHQLTATTRILLRIGDLLGLPSWVYELPRELRSFAYRIGILVKRYEDLGCACTLGFQFGQDATGRLVTCSRTLGRRLDIHKFQSKGYPPSQVDLAIFLAGWNAGAKWSDDRPHFCTRRNDAGCLPCMEASDHSLF
jgi:hypothetical protein